MQAVGLDVCATSLLTEKAGLSYLQFNDEFMTISVRTCSLDYVHCMNYNNSECRSIRFVIAV